MVRRVGIIATAAGVALSAGAWGASLYGVTWRSRVNTRNVVDLGGGILHAHNGGSYTVPGWQLGWAGPMRWWPHDGKIWTHHPARGTAYWSLKLPLWMPLGACTLGLAGFWRPWDRRGARRRRGLCARCGYDARGLAVCPECGTATRPRG